MSELSAVLPNPGSKPGVCSMRHVREITPDVHLTFLRGEAFITSREVATQFDKQHGHVLEAIREIEKRDKTGGGQSHFRLTSFADQWNREQPEYLLTEEGFYFLTLGFSGDKADERKWKVVKALRAAREELLRYVHSGIRMDSATLIEALYDGQLSMFQAKQIQEFTPEEQQQILEVPKREIARTIKNLKMLKSGGQAAMASLGGVNDWYTPSKWIELARSAMGSIDVDPASHYVAQRTVQADDWYDQEQDGLKHDWPGNVWLNPPYSRGLIDKFVDKLLDQFARGDTKQAIVLVDSRTDTQWFNKLCSMASAVAFTRGRVHFYNETVKSSSPVSGSAFVYLGPRMQEFKLAFDSDCIVFFALPASILGDQP